MSWDWAYAISILPLLAKAAIVTVQAALGGFAIALVLGLILALLRRSHVRAISWPVGAAVEFIRSTPLLIQLFFLYFGLPQFGIRPTPLAVGIIAFGVHFSTYLSEVFRAGLDAVPRGQWDAATALNFKRFDRMVRIILPQAVPPMVPVLGNYLVLMLKDTPVLAAISVLELLQTARALASQSFRYLEPLTLVGLFFLALSVIAGFAIQALEARLTRKRS